ncbi:uncharacterized protein LOC119976250 [Scyliorhinus canicula]|uniref:uncharacterized protein LOC119976250 n=1 Tax=Scyliorhinus canicula TaxID=7830 RepID=UPI0018F71323|nr:uncharacterized protein LOC119976250 [Scyliorhinus canicula]
MTMILFAQQIILVFSVTLWQNAVGDSSTLLQDPMTIKKRSGETAVISCKLSRGHFTEDMTLIWYNYINQSQSKIGEIDFKKNSSRCVEQVILTWDLDRATMEMAHLMKNNSGAYGCQLLALYGSVIKKANATNIIVSDSEIPIPENRNNTDNVTEKSQNNEAKIQIIVAAVIAAFIIICLLIYILFRFRPKKQGTDASPHAADASCQKSEDPISTVCSMDYAVLKIPGKNHQHNLASSVASDDSCYATIVFAPQQQATGVQKTITFN